MRFDDLQVGLAGVASGLAVAFGRDYASKVRVDRFFDHGGLGDSFGLDGGDFRGAFDVRRVG